MPDDADRGAVQQDGVPDTSPPPIIEQPVGSPNAAQIAKSEMDTKIENLGDELHTAERWMIWLTGAIAVFGFCTVVVAALQWNAMRGQLSEMHTTGIDTHTLAEASKKQADKMETISDSIGAAVTELKETAEAAKIQADISAKSADIAAMSFEASERPYLGIDRVSFAEGNRMVSFDAILKNFGVNPADAVEIHYNAFVNGNETGRWDTLLGDIHGILLPGHERGVHGETIGNLSSGDFYLIRFRSSYYWHGHAYQYCEEWAYLKEVKKFEALGACHPKPEEKVINPMRWRPQQKRKAN